MLTIMLMAGMFLGAIGVAIPESVHAEDEYPGPYELRVNLDKVTNADGQDVTADVWSIEVTVGGRTVSSNRNEHDLTISRLNEAPQVYALRITTGEGHSIFGPAIYPVSGASGSAEIPITPPYRMIKSSYTLTHYHENDHTWEYSAEDNVITATCTNTETTCPLKSPTLTLDAKDKVYDGKPVTATLTPSETWTTANGLPEIDQSAITYSSNYSKNAGSYIASYTLDDATTGKSVEIAKGFTIDRKGVLVGGVKVENKEYDGSKEAVVDTSGAAILGTVDGDKLSLLVYGEYEDPEEGHDKTVHMHYYLTGADADNYYIIDSGTTPSTVKANIYVTGKGGPDDSDDEENTEDEAGDEDNSDEVTDEADGSTGENEGSKEDTVKTVSTKKRSPNTGDANDIKELLALMLISTTALGAMGFRRRRENRKYGA